MRGATPEATDDGGPGSIRAKPIVAVLGTGRMGTALGRAFARAGREVIFGSRNPEAARVRTRDSAAPLPVADLRSAVARAEIVALATLWDDTPDVLRRAGDFGGRPLIDATNPEAADGRGLALGHSTSGAEEIASLARGARVAKAFNHVYAELLERGGDFGPERASVFYCGDDEDARSAAARLIADVGFSPVDAGPLSAARLLEPAAMLMVELVRGRRHDPDRVALHLLRRAARGNGGITRKTFDSNFLITNSCADG